MAAVLACGDKAALSHFSAAVLWGMLSGEGKIHVTTPIGSAAAWARGASRGGGARTNAGSVPASPSRPRRAHSSTLPTSAPRRTLERAIDEAEFLRLDCTGLAPRRGRKGCGTLMRVLAEHRPGSTRTRTHLEELFIALCDRYRLPRPEVNVYVEGYECDFVWPEQRLIVETDGGAAHGTPRAMKRDPIRDADLMAAGWRVWRLTYELLFKAPETVAEHLIAFGITPAPLPAARGARRRS